MCTGIGIDISLFHNLPSISYHLTNVNVISIFTLKSTNVIVLALTKNKIYSICKDIDQFPGLIMLNVAKNNVELISENCFDSFENLRNIVLKQNQISNVEV